MMNSQGRPGRGPGRSVAKEQLWRRHVARQAKSKQSVRDYCAAADISEPSFYAWRRELAQRDAAAGSPPAQDQRADLPAPRADLPAPRADRPAPRTGRRGPRTVRPSTGLRPRFLPVTISPPSGHSIEAVLASGLILRVPAHDAVALRMVLDLLEGRAC